ncbi:hypothetical protein MANES_09G076567v8 [Manihot esculenta]|uniref:Uncharacterized protein n=1 Tax=Manihot esculenta TaxID=3983 RepID=A0ACB7H3U5_MANES|nr:hypothetical protein MANES_09G076567v8 [Manihot esculenta]
MTNMNMRADPLTGYPGRTYRFHTRETVYSSKSSKHSPSAVNHFRLTVFYKSF